MDLGVDRFDHFEIQNPRKWSRFWDANQRYRDFEVRNFENLNKFLKAPNLVINIFRDKLTKAYADLKGEINNQINKKNLMTNTGGSV